MATYQCCISGIHLPVPHLPVHIPAYKMVLAHPIFYLDQKQLFPLVTKHHSGHLTPTDSYLLFLALLHSTDSVVFTTICSLEPTSSQTQNLIDRYLKHLVSTIWQTNAIIHPSFKQPGYKVTADSSDLSSIPAWIKAWQNNIEDFKLGLATRIEIDTLIGLEQKLMILIRTDVQDAKLANAVAAWAANIGGFPIQKHDSYTSCIRSCFNPTKMFNTSRELILEVKEYCEQNIEVGTSYYHTLMQTLHKGYRNHTGYLGLGSLPTLDSSTDSFTLVSSDSSIEAANLASAIELAPKTEPIRAEYPDLVSFLKAKLRYRLAASLSPALIPEATPTPTATKLSDTIDKEDL